MFKKTMLRLLVSWWVVSILWLFVFPIMWLVWDDATVLAKGMTKDMWDCY